MSRCFATADEGALRQLISVLPGVSFRYRVMAENKGSFIDIDGDTMSLFGLRQDSILKDSRALWFQCSKEDRRQVAESMRNVRQSWKPWQAQWSIQLGGGYARRIQGQAVVTEKHDNGGVTWSGIFQCLPRAPANNFPSVTQDILNALPGFVYRYRYTPDSQSFFDYVSPGVKDVFGCTDQKLMSDGEITWRIMHPDDRDKIAQKMKKNIAEMTPWCHTWRICPPKRDTVWVKSESRKPIRLLDGSYIWDGYITDITEQHKVLEMIDAVPGILYRYRHYPDGRCYFDYASQGCRDLLECSPEQLCEDADILWKLSLAEDASEVLRKLQRSMGDHKRWCVSWRIRTPGGQLKWIKDESLAPVPLPDGGFEWCGIITDTTHEHQLENALTYQRHALQISEQTRQHMIDMVPGMVFQARIIPGKGMSFLYLSQAAQDIFGLSREELMENGELVWSRIHPNDRDGYRHNIMEAASTHKDLDYTWRTCPNTNTVLWVRGQSRHFSTLPDGSIIRVGVTMDVTREMSLEKNRQQLEDDVHEARQKLADILKVVPGCVYMVRKTPEGEWTYPFMSDAAASLFERPVEDLKKDSSLILEYAHPDDRDMLSTKLNDSFRFNGMMHVIWRIITPGGTIKWIRGDSRPFRTEPDGTILRAGFFIDVTHERNLEQSLNSTTLRLRNIIDAIPGGVYQSRVSPDGHQNFIFANHQVWTQVGLPADTPLSSGYKLLEGIIDDDRDKHRQSSMHSLETLAPRQVRFRFRRYDTGKIVSIEVHTRASPVDNSKDVLFTGVALDVTSNVKTEQELLEQKIKAEEANVAKSTFLANVSHEMRTPLNGILGYAQLLSHELALSGQAARNLHSLKQCSDHLLAVINEVLDMAKIESGRLEFEFKPMALYRLLNEVESVVSPLANSKGLEFALHTSADLPGYIKGDATRLRQILINLLNNAVKFTSQGSVVLDITMNDGQLQFSVTDTGCGIPREQLDSIFKPFERLNAHHAIEGTGLGLSIIQRIVDRLEGTVTAESQEGKGSCFTVRIPCEEAEVVEEISEPTDFTLQPLNLESPPRLLVVDDRESNRDVMSQWLTLGGFAVETANNGQEALDTLRTKPFAAVLSDLRMPVMSGFELIEAIQSDEQLKSIATVAVSASVFPEQVRRVLASGFQAFLPKPCSLPKLFDTLYTLLDIQPQEQAAAQKQQAAATTVKAPPLPESERQIIADMLDLGDVEGLQQYVLKLRTTPEFTDIALRLSERLEEFDMEGFRSVLQEQ